MYSLANVGFIKVHKKSIVVISKTQIGQQLLMMYILYLLHRFQLNNNLVLNHHISPKGANANAIVIANRNIHL